MDSIHERLSNDETAQMVLLATDDERAAYRRMLCRELVAQSLEPTDRRLYEYDVEVMIEETTTDYLDRLVSEMTDD